MQAALTVRRGALWHGCESAGANRGAQFCRGAAEAKTARALFSLIGEEEAGWAGLGRGGAAAARLCHL
jgi:hypothetical protein